MDFGLFFLMQRDEQWSEQAVFASGLEQMLAAEALGYHSVWIAEHHFNDYGLCPTPPVLAAFVAAPEEPAATGIVILPDVRGLYRFYEELALRFAERLVVCDSSRFDTLVAIPL